MCEESVRGHLIRTALLASQPERRSGLGDLVEEGGRLGSGSRLDGPERETKEKSFLFVFNNTNTISKQIQI